MSPCPGGHLRPAGGSAPDDKSLGKHHEACSETTARPPHPPGVERDGHLCWADLCQCRHPALCFRRGHVLGLRAPHGERHSRLEHQDHCTSLTQALLWGGSLHAVNPQPRWASLTPAC